MTRSEIITEIKSMPTKHREKCIEFSGLTPNHVSDIVTQDIYPELSAWSRLEAAIDATYAYFEAIETHKKYRKK